MSSKQVFKKILAAMAVILAILPIIVTFSAALTSLFNKMDWYVALQNYIVPFEARLVVVLLRLVGISGVVTPTSGFAMLLQKPGGEYLPVILSWNCLGWQSLVLLGLTLTTGLRGDWRLISKIEVSLLGIFGTFLTNIFRMTFVTTLMYYWNEVAARVVHDYLAAFVSLIWLSFFWWFSYSYVLEEKGDDLSSKSSSTIS